MAYVRWKAGRWRTFDIFWHLIYILAFCTWRANDEIQNVLRERNAGSLGGVLRVAIKAHPKRFFRVVATLIVPRDRSASRGEHY